MMNKYGLPTLFARIVSLAAVYLLLAGCSSSGNLLELTSYKDPYFPREYEVELEDCVYYTGPSGDYHILGQSRRMIEDDPKSEIVQLLHIHLFWKPKPGKTFDNPTSVDATIRYAIISSGGVARYTGTGYVYPKRKRWSEDLAVEIENARLRLEVVEGDHPELLGAARLVGELLARRDAGVAMDLRRELDLCAELDRP